MGFFSNLFHHDDIQGTKKYIYITGMVCQNCSKHVTEALKAVDGVGKVKVDLMRGQAEVVVADSVSDDTLVNVLPPIEARASCFNENSATDSKELRRLTLSPQA